jgi:hypothetical protein
VTISKISTITANQLSGHPKENHIIIIGIAESIIHRTGIIHKMKTIIASVNMYGKVVAQCTNAIKYNQITVRTVFTIDIRL